MPEGGVAGPVQGGPSRVEPAQAGSSPEASGVETEAAKAERELGEVVRGVEVAAREWGVRPDHLEGRFVSALLAALAWLGRLIRAASADMKASAREAREASVLAARENRAAVRTEYEALRVANEMSANVLEQARAALAGSEVQRERVIGRFVEAVVPQIVERIGEAVVLRERRHNRRVQWGRAAGIAGSALAILAGGYVWGNQGSGEATAAGAVALDRIRRCQAAPVKDGRTGEAYCRLRDLLPPS